MAIRKIRLRRGLESQLPTLDVGEPGFTTDTKRLYIGSSTGNVLVNDFSSAVSEARVEELIAEAVEALSIPSIEGLATTEYVDQAISEIEVGGGGTSTTLTHLELTSKGPLIILEPELGEPVVFSKSEGTPTDEIDEGLTFARGNQGAIYNIELEEEYDRSNYLSPLGTLWNSDGFAGLINFREREYVTFREALNGRVGNNILDAELIMWDTANNKYYKFEFSEWGEGNESSSFAYTRTEITDLNLFAKSNYGSEVDEISEGLHITRGNQGWLYNPLEESQHDDETPANSLWNFDGWDDFSNATSREYKYLENVYGGNFENISGAKAVMLDTTTNKYWAIQFLSWTPGQNGGGFSYNRYELDLTKLNEGVKFADGTVIKTAVGLGRVKSTASRGRRIEEVTGSKTVSVTERITSNYESTSARTTSSNYEIFVSRTIGNDLDLIISEYRDNDIDVEFEISFDNQTFRSAWLSSVQETEYWFYYSNGDSFVPQTQGDPVYIRVVSGGDPVTWWNRSDLPSGSDNLRGAIIDYHAYVVGRGTIIGTIHIARDDGDEFITHTETSSGSSNLSNSDLWYVTSEGRIRFRQLDGEARTLKVHWSAKVFYGEEYYD